MSTNIINNNVATKCYKIRKLFIPALDKNSNITLIKIMKVSSFIKKKKINILCNYNIYNFYIIFMYLCILLYYL
jgi:hypothetical protein